jgi:Tol biopolymer transport system component
VLSADGGFVAFQSLASGLVSGQLDANFVRDVFLYDRVTASTTLVSRTAASPVTTGDGGSESPEISADGRFVAFESRATDLVPGQVDGNGERDVFLYDRASGGTSLVSGTAGAPLVTGNGESRNPVLSADGGVVAFRSDATDLVAGQVDENGGPDLFVHDRPAGATGLLTRAAGSPVTAGDAPSTRRPALSADGRFAVFRSPATDLVAGQQDDNGEEDVFLVDRLAARTTLVSRRLGGPARAGRRAAGAAVTANGPADGVELSADGAVVVFTSAASDLTADADANGLPDLFAWERPCDDRPCRRPGARPPP